MTKAVAGRLIAVIGMVVVAHAPVLARQEQDGGATGETFQSRLSASFIADWLPERDVTEARPQISFEVNAAPSPALTVRLDVVAEGLVRQGRGTTHDALVRVRDAWVEARAGKYDVRVGFGRLVWGRLDEISPLDVLNPIDASTFLLHGKSDARRPVALARVRWTPSERLAVEAIALPVFRRSVFDQLDVEASPFNLANDLVFPALTSERLFHAEPDASWSNLSGGVRVQTSLGRADVSAMVFRGFEGFGPVTFELVTPFEAGPAVVGQGVEHHTRVTMAGVDFEAVLAGWALRGEAAGFTERRFAARSRPGLVGGKSFDAGAGFDRRAGDFHLFGSALVHRDWSAEDPAVARTDVSFVGSIERAFARERYVSRVFGLVNPADDSMFVRALLRWHPRDAVVVDASAGAFVGSGDDAVSRFSGRDFVLLTFRYYR